MPRCKVSPAKLAANRANARASTGPRTKSGKARAAKNSRRHGLSLPIFSDPNLSAEVKKLAHQIAGANASARRKDLACRIAEAQFDLVRVRRARHAILVEAFFPPERIFTPGTMNIVDELIEGLQKGNPKFELPKLLRDTLYPLDGLKKVAAMLSDLTSKLAALDRYEGRALSRRKFAIRDFDIASRKRGVPS